MKKAVELIREHQHDLHGHVIHIPDNITTDLERTRVCVEHAIGHCNENKMKTDFPKPQTYERKQWGGTVLNVSVEFLDELVKVVRHNVQTKMTPKSIISKNHQINTA